MATKWLCHRRINIVSCGQIANDNTPTQSGFQVMLVQTAGYVSWKVEQSATLWASVFQDIDLLWSPVLIPNILAFLTGSDETGWDHMAGSNLTLLSSYYTDHMAGSNLTLLSNYYTDHSVPSSCLSLDEVNCSVLYVPRPYFSHLMYFVFPDNSCILLKIKCQSFQGLCGYFICLLFLLLHLLKYSSPLVPWLPIQPSSIPSSH